MTFLKFTQVILIIIVLTSCNAAEFAMDAQTRIDESTFRPRLTYEDLDLNGSSWQTTCLNDGSLDYYVNVTFTSTIIDSNSYFHTLNSNCGSATLFQDYRQSTYTADWYNTYNNPTVRQVTVFDAGYVSAFNSTTECGNGAWVASSAFNALAVNCLGVTRTNGVIVTSSYKVIDYNTVILDGRTYYRQ